jgi:hypothetical protein
MSTEQRILQTILRDTPWTVKAYKGQLNVVIDMSPTQGFELDQIRTWLYAEQDKIIRHDARIVLLEPTKPGTITNLKRLKTLWVPVSLRAIGSESN